MIRRLVIVALSVAWAVALAGCDYLPFGYTPIKDIVAAPAKVSRAAVTGKANLSSLRKEIKNVIDILQR